MKEKVIILGAGPGGLACGMPLTKNGYDVHIYEKKDRVGGRNGSIEMNGYVFDIGPTFFMMREALDDIFEMAGRKLEDYVELTKLDPMYRLQFKDKTFFPSTDEEKMKEEMERVFPGSSSSYMKYRKKEKKKYEKLTPCLQVPYGKISDYFSKQLIQALPYLDAHVSLYDVLGRYFEGEDLKISFTFQAKYIGMSPWEAPGTFSIISYIEHGGGIYHVAGGLNQLSQAMAKSIEEDGGKINLNAPVKRIIVEDGEAKGIELENGEIEKADCVVINADFANSMSKLVEQKHRQKYTDHKLKRMKYSCSTFMLYLGVDKLYDHLEHHNIIFADNYEKNVYEITHSKILPEDPSFYIQNASLTDKTLAPEGKSAVYVLVPIGNTTGPVYWDEKKDEFAEKILDMMESKANMKDLREHIEEMKILTPKDWDESMDVYNGATFNLGHNIGQMLYFRPHNEFEEFKNCYLVGGGTHPGSGLPTIFESGKISANLIMGR